MYIFFCPAWYLMFSAVDVTSQLDCRCRCLFATNNLSPFPSSFFDLPFRLLSPSPPAHSTPCALLHLLRSVHTHSIYGI